MLLFMLLFTITRSWGSLHKDITNVKGGLGILVIEKYRVSCGAGRSVLCSLLPRRQHRCYYHLPRGRSVVQIPVRAIKSKKKTRFMYYSVGLIVKH